MLRRTSATRTRTDSTVLAYIMKLLNERHQYGLDLFLLSVDEGIAGYRDDSLEVRPRAKPPRSARRRAVHLNHWRTGVRVAWLRRR